MRYAHVSLGCLSIAVALMAATDASDWDAPVAKWHQGPVKYLLSKEEAKAYKKLEEPEERKRFVEEFWVRRDPTPGTPENEYRKEFYRRAREAAAQYSEEGGKGWQDDRGRVFIVLGPPTKQTEGSDLLGGGSAPSSGVDNPTGGPAVNLPGESAAPESTVKSLTFVYDVNPITGEKGPFELNFRSDVSGGYMLRDRIDWDLPVLRGLVHREIPAAPEPMAAAEMEPATQEAAPAPVEEITPESELMAYIRANPETETTIPLDVTANFYKAADESTFATLTLQVDGSALPTGTNPDSLTIAAEILDPETEESVQRFLREGQFGGHSGNATASNGDDLLFQAERGLNPGTYKAVFAVKDPTSGAVGKLEKPLDVPSYKTDGLVLSSVCLVRNITPLGAPPAPGSMTPFVLGSFSVVPRSNNVFKDGDELTFYYQIYGAQTDETDQAKVDLSYKFEKKAGDTWRMVGRAPVLTPGQQRLVQAYGLPLTRWPAGDYLISIDVTDTLAGATASAQIPFTIAASTGGEKPGG